MVTSYVSLYYRVQASCREVDRWTFVVKHLIFFLSSQILTARNLSKNNVVQLITSLEILEKFEESEVSSILCSIPKRKGTRELNEFVAVRISSSDTTRLTEEKALRKERGEEAREDKEEEGGIVDRGIYCTTVGQRIDFMPHRFGRFPFPLPFPSFRVWKTEREREKQEGEEKWQKRGGGSKKTSRLRMRRRNESESLPRLLFQFSNCYRAGGDRSINSARFPASTIPEVALNKSEIEDRVTPNGCSQIRRFDSNPTALGIVF